MTLGLGYEDPADKDDRWRSLQLAYEVGIVRVGGFFGHGRNAGGERHRARLVSIRFVQGAGTWIASAGHLADTDRSRTLDRQLSAGYHYSLSRRTTLYADLIDERADGGSGHERRTGYDPGLRHNF